MNNQQNVFQYLLYILFAPKILPTFFGLHFCHSQGCALIEASNQYTTPSTYYVNLPHHHVTHHSTRTEQFSVPVVY